MLHLFVLTWLLDPGPPPPRAGRGRSRHQVNPPTKPTHLPCRYLPCRHAWRGACMQAGNALELPDLWDDVQHQEQDV